MDTRLPFDEFAASFGVEKVKTIGDAYMAVCGLPHEVDDHPEWMVKMALGMCAEMEKIRTEFNGIDLEIRIGIHTGPCVAGVIGRNRFIYDLWGDTANIASRMESTGVTDKTQISEATYLRVKNLFEVDARGQTPIKGRGMLSTYLVRNGRMENDWLGDARPAVR